MFCSDPPCSISTTCTLHASGLVADQQDKRHGDGQLASACGMPEWHTSRRLQAVFQRIIRGRELKSTGASEQRRSVCKMQNIISTSSCSFCTQSWEFAEKIIRRGQCIFTFVRQRYCVIYFSIFMQRFLHHLFYGWLPLQHVSIVAYSDKE